MDYHATCAGFFGDVPSAATSEAWLCVACQPVAATTGAGGAEDKQVENLSWQAIAARLLAVPVGAEYTLPPSHAAAVIELLELPEEAEMPAYHHHWAAIRNDKPNEGEQEAFFKRVGARVQSSSQKGTPCGLLVFVRCIST